MKAEPEPAWALPSGPPPPGGDQPGGNSFGKYFLESCGGWLCICDDLAAGYPSREAMIGEHW